MCVKFASDDQLEHVIMFLDDRLYYRVQGSTGAPAPVCGLYSERTI